MDHFSHLRRKKCLLLEKRPKRVEQKFCDLVNERSLPMPEVQTLLTGLAFGESPRWHDGRLWFCNWVAQEIVAADVEGKSEVIARMPSFPFSIDWLPDGRLLVVSGREGLLLRRESDGELVTHAILSGLASIWNEIVVDGRRFLRGHAHRLRHRCRRQPVEPAGMGRARRLRP